MRSPEESPPESRKVGARGCRRGMGNQCSTGTEFQLGEMKKLWQRLNNNVKIFNATKLYI